MELTRTPQLWNFNEALRRLPPSTPAGVLDAGFGPSHESLDEARLTRTHTRTHFHGSSITSI